MPHPLRSFLPAHVLHAAGMGGLLLASWPAEAASQPINRSELFFLLGLLTVILIGVILLYLRHTRVLKTVQLTKQTLEESYALLDTIFNDSPIGMMVQDKTRRIVRSNAALEAILSVRPEVLDNMGTALNSLITDEKARKTLMDAYSDLLVHPSHMLKVKVPVRTPNGRDKWLLVSAQTLVSNGTISGILWQVQDITREENALRELQRVSSLDPLTGTLNRRAFMQLWRRERARALRLRSPLSLVIIDLDLFKSINDQYGHQAGDEVLRAIAHALRQATRDTDIVARFGGEEFVLLLPDTALQGAVEVAEKIREATERSTLLLSPDHRPISLTLSAGVAEWTPHEPFESLYQRADAALYEAKRAGRNQVRALHNGDALREHPNGS